MCNLITGDSTLHTLVRSKFFESTCTIPDMRRSKTLLKSTNVDQKSLETVFSIAIYRQTGDKWQSKTLFLTIFDLRSSVVLTFLIATYPVCVLNLC